MYKQLVLRVDKQVIGCSCCVGSQLIYHVIVGSGVISDLYPVERRGAAFGKYFFGVFIGPLTGPILGIYNFGSRKRKLGLITMHL